MKSNQEITPPSNSNHARDATLAPALGGCWGGTASRRTNLGGEFRLAFDWRTGTFQGEQFAIFCFNRNPGNSFVDVDWFHFTDKE